jgi:hypothetical protein
MVGVFPPILQPMFQSVGLVACVADSLARLAALQNNNYVVLPSTNFLNVTGLGRDKICILFKGVSSPQRFYKLEYVRFLRLFNDTLQFETFMGVFIPLNNESFSVETGEEGATLWRFNTLCRPLLVITVAERSQTRTVSASSVSKIVGSNPTRGLDVYVRLFSFVLSCVHVEVLRRADPPSKESYRLCIELRN